jgi:hypothetical protein
LRHGAVARSPQRLVFKYTFGEHPEILRRFLNALLPFEAGDEEQVIRDLQLVSVELPKHQENRPEEARVVREAGDAGHGSTAELVQEIEIARESAFIGDLRPVLGCGAAGTAPDFREPARGDSGGV